MKIGCKVYVLIAITIYVIVYFLVKLNAHWRFRTYAWDLGIFNQAFWSTLHGRLLYYTVEPFYTRTGCFLGAHFSPILLLLVPFYAICPRPEFLLFMSTLIVALGAIAAYEITNFFLKEEKTAMAFGIFYLLYPPLQGVALSDFCLESIMTTLFLFIVYFLVKGDFKKLTLAVILGLLTHEASAPVIGFIGLYGMWYYKSIKNRGFQASLVILASSIPYFFLAQAMRIFFGWTGRSSLWNEWRLIGAKGLMDLPLKIIMNPAGAWASLTYDGISKILYLLMFLVPCIFLPFLSLDSLIPAIPFLFISFFSSYSTYYNIQSHYPAFLVPFFFVGLIRGILKFRSIFHFNIHTIKIAQISLLLCILSSLFFIPILLSTSRELQVDSGHEKIIYSFMAEIPQNASVLTQNNIFPHLSSRFNAYTIPCPIWGKEYRQVAEKILNNLSEVKIEYVFVDIKSEPYSASAAELIIDKFVSSDKYITLREEDGVMLFKLREE